MKTSLKSQIVAHKFVAGLIATLVVLLALVIIGNVAKAPTSNDANDARQDQSVTIKGELVCLPHKDMQSPHTMECALGLKSTGGAYYGLRNAGQGEAGSLSAVPTNAAVEVSGTLVEEESDIYQMAGTITVKSFTQ